VSVFRRTSPDPLWKEEFSVHAADERYVSRRQFSKFLVLTSLAMFVGNIWVLIKSVITRKPVYPEAVIGDIGDFATSNVKLFAYPTPDDHCILVRLAPDHVVAYSQKCTHLSCAVYYSPERNQLLCPCHNGVFAVEDGSNVAGPPARPLPRIALETRGRALIARGVETSERG
jgi:nitrite reductase/ring-hydroxylating ferredoxin subunit